ncbi:MULTISPECIES: hypothetical protein [Methylophaga]|jgi:hypothetical protein|uniref:hypothetical protein n=1 Tax=Methylophaga TaxID=40222 RepID=UPI001CF544BE|nr:MULTISPECIES: hypothetical protein [Methylophaga]MCB2426123.1 hypothetical protein [Methylophaga pinxianii]MDX1750696.1 hypothetical protein [Methylophaga sp.]UPH47352.1 hypothetical protein LGT42_015040 [Methylophaga pinxianii]
MAEKKKTLKVIHGGREDLEVQKANEILKALLVDKDRDTAFQIAESLKPRGALALTADKQRKSK